MEAETLASSDPSARRKAVALLFTAVLVAAIPAMWFAWDAVTNVTDEIEDGRLRLAQLAATQADRVVVEAFYEIELMAQSLTVEHGADSLESQANALRELHGRGASFHSGVVLLNGAGDTIASIPVDVFDRVEVERILRTAGTARDRAVSMPWLDVQTGHAMAALSVPLYKADGTRAATVVGVMDLAEPLISDLILPAARLGPTGHADLVDERGIVLASTEPGHVLTAGEHPNFYEEAAATRRAQVDSAVHDHDLDATERSDLHIMAYAPLRNAPWGVAMGADEQETLKPVRRLQSRLVILGSASTLTLLLGIGLAVGWIARQESE